VHVSDDSRLRAEAGRPSGIELLRRGRKDRRATRELLRTLAPADLAAACQDLRPEARNEFLMLIDHPEEVVPLLPAAEVCITIRAGGMSEAAWLLELGTPEQRQACVDLDVWREGTIRHERAIEWIDALIEAGRDTLVKGLTDLDPEFWVLSLQRMTDVVVVGREDERPEGFFTEDGVVYFRGQSDADFARVKEVMQTAFSEAQPYYWKLVYGALFELPSECEEFALRWRQGRLADLGFPDFETAMRVYRPLQPDALESLPLDSLESESPAALVRQHELPAQLRGSLVGEALSELSPERAADVLGYILGVANSIAVADALPLSDGDSVPKALEKAVRGIDRGLRALAERTRTAPARLLETTRPLDLCRLGFTLDGTERELPAPEASDATDAGGEDVEDLFTGRVVGSA